jgi:ankyrin repeat protein
VYCVRRGSDGRTSVHAAAFAANVHIISLLVDAGGDLRLHDREGRSARDWAMSIIDSRKKRKMLKYLDKVKLTAINTSCKDVLLEQSLHSKCVPRLVIVLVF